MEKKMKKILGTLAVAAAAGTAQAHEVFYWANLSGPAEAPPNNSGGIGYSFVTIDLDLATMRVQCAFSGLTGNTTASHIHGPTANPFQGTAGVMTTTPTFAGFPLGVTSGTYDITLDLTQASTYNPAFVSASGGTISQAMNRMLLAISEGRAYHNIHTSAFPGGEIRGFLVEVPAPGAAGLLAMAGLAAARRRRA